MLQIILVEDNPADAMLIQTAVKRAAVPAEIVALNSGVQALEFLTGRDVAIERPLVLLDLDLPKMSGLEVLETIRSNDALAPLPVVVLSSSSDPSSIERCYRIGANSYINKPAHWDEFLSVIAQLIRYWSLAALPPTPSRADSC